MSRSWWAPDPALAAAGVEGERLVADVRLAVMALVLITPVYKLFEYPGNPVFLWGFAVTATAAAAALALWLALRSGWWRPWIAFASSALDISLVSAALVTFVFVGSPLVALNSTVTFEIFFLAILATSLRYDVRVSLVTGLLALAQYGGLWLFAATAFDLDDPVYADGVGGYFPVNIVTRLILLAAAMLLAVAIVRRAQSLLFLAARDRLTGLYNRGHLDQALALEVERSLRYSHPLTLVVLDVDHFKRVNDQHGHAVGDHVLQRLADRLTAGVRRTDIAARYGGEEFVLLLPETPAAEAVARTAALRAELAGGPVRLPGGGELVVGFSAGVATLPEDADSAERLFEVADARLLAAKRGGRGRTVAEG